MTALNPRKNRSEEISVCHLVQTLTQSKANHKVRSGFGGLYHKSQYIYFQAFIYSLGHISQFGGCPEKPPGLKMTQTRSVILMKFLYNITHMQDGLKKLLRLTFANSSFTPGCLFQAVQGLFPVPSKSSGQLQKRKNSFETGADLVLYQTVFFVFNIKVNQLSPGCMVWCPRREKKNNYTGLKSRVSCIEYQASLLLHFIPDFLVSCLKFQTALGVILAREYI